jgi:uncharacterized protein involved in copper resistance
MSKVNLFLSSLAVLAVAVVLAGCSGGEDTAAPTAVEGSEADHDHADHDHADHADHDHAEHAEHADVAPAIKEAMAQLSNEDRAAAEAQTICPVSGTALGSMGKPCKVTVTTSAGKERTVFLCCAGCESAIKENPDKYLAKLDK